MNSIRSSKIEEHGAFAFVFFSFYFCPCIPDKCCLRCGVFGAAEMSEGIINILVRFVG